MQAPGFAATSVAVQVPTPSDLRVEMRPGQIVRGRIVDQDQQGVAQARVELTAGPGYRQESRPEFQMKLKTDSEGCFTWDQAPSNSLPVTIFKTGYSAREASLSTDGTETLVVLEKADRLAFVRVVGRVVDDQTEAPIERFRVVVGDLNGNGAIKSGEDGIFSLTLYKAEISIEVRSAGYQPSRQELPPGGATEHFMEFRLQAAAGWVGLVMLPDGRPASGAEVALITIDKQPTLERRRFTNREFANVTVTDADGGFHFEPELPEIPAGRMLVAVHDTGYAEYDADRWLPGAILRLQPWGRVQGIVQGRSTYPAQLKVFPLVRSWNPWLGLALNHDPFLTVPDERGEFVLDHLPPGCYSIGLLPEGSGVADKRLTLQVLPGTTSRIEVSDDGSAVAGQLVAPDLSPDFDFTHSRALLVRRQSRPVDLPRVRFNDFPNAEAYERASREQEPELIAYWQSTEGLSAWMEERRYAVVLHPDGTFVGRAVPPGDYDLQVIVRSVPPGQPNRGARVKSPVLMSLTSLEPVRIEPAVGAASNEPVDVGPIALGKRF